VKQELCLAGNFPITASMKRPWLLAALLPLVAATGCINVKAHIIVDVNVKMDKALDDVFGDLDKKDPSMNLTSK
jgi:hypothetical protein